MNERGIQFGSSGELIGTVTEAEPTARRADGLGLLLLNAGLVHRVGPHRINVKLARLAAKHGIPSIRFDLSGRGDSGAGERGVGFRAQAVSDIGAALSALQARTGTRRYMLFGICSGGDDGVAAAAREPKIVSLVVLDPYVFPTIRWRARALVSRLRKFGILGGIAYWRDMRVAESSLGGKAIESFGREIPPIDDFVGLMRALRARGVAIRLVYSGSTVDRRDFDAQCRMLLGRTGLAGSVKAELLPDVDHVITSLGAQQRVLQRFETWLADVPDDS